jgi:hypothetical protein
VTESSAAAAAPSPSTVRKVALAACAATSIEWYDFFIYLTAAALVFPKLFFPADKARPQAFWHLSARRR